MPVLARQQPRRERVVGHEANAELDAAGRWLDSLPIAGQIAVLGLVFTLTCAAFYLVLGTFARAILQSRPSAAAIVTGSAGVGMVVVGALLIAERLI